MEDHCPEYTNPHGVAIMLQDMAIYVQAQHPLYKFDAGTALSFIRWCETPEEFFQLFNIKEFKDLGKIKQPLLEKLYLQGNAQLFCLIEDQELTFQKKATGMMVSDEWDYVHEMNEIFSRPEEFVEYTRQYYKIETAH